MGKGRDKKKEERKDTKELGWREGVMKEPMLGALDCKWSSLEEWAAHFDKKKMEEGKEKSKLVAAAEEKARIKLLQKIHSSVTTKLMTTLLEVSSLVVNGTEVAMRATADDVGAMLAAMNGIILGHHFGFNKNKMFPYLRRFASDRMVDIVCDMLDNCPNAAAKVLEIQNEIATVMASKEEEARELITLRINQMLASEADMLDFHEVPANLDGTPEGVSAAKEQAEKMIAAGGMYAADFAVAKMDTLIAVLIKTMSSVLDNMCTLYAAKKAAGGVPSCGGKLSLDTGAMEEIREEIWGNIETEYGTVLGQVANQVQGLVSLLDKLMAPSGGEDED